MDVKQVINLIKDKNEKGLSILYDYYAPTLNGVIINIVKSDVLAEEILQQTFLKIWNNIDNYDESKASLFTWMNQIARNTAIDHYRLMSFDIQRKIVSIDDTMYESKTYQLDTDKIDVEIILKEIDEKYKQVLFKVYIQGYTHVETAKILDIPLGTVKTRIRIALNQLRKKLALDEMTLFELTSLLMLIWPTS